MPEELQGKVAELGGKLMQAHGARAELAEANKKLIFEFKQAAGKANELRKKRGESNAKARECIEKKKPVYEKLSQLRKQIDEQLLKRKELEKLVTKDYAALKRQAEAMDWILQTEAHSPAEEKALSKKLTALEAELQPAAGLEGCRKKIGLLFAEKKMLDEELKKLDASIGSLFSEAKTLHEKAVESSKKAESLSKQIGGNFEKLGEREDAAEFLHKELSGVREELHKQEKAEADASREKEQQKKTAEKGTLQSKADEIRKKLFSGKKITSEEMQVLAKVDG